ncbi:ATP-binding protein [Paraburkholderia bonniea]|uniref:sensor histidine kinase n=1 Tax=Paraburkholderia bonniea TaxID=2152891 RepID=UPI00129130BD|nr:ATP-binding protein [Paraburkholderia bonniea]WJF91715.1 ATP-binding protein [Paraburkholderia bonniea]WJF95035.1 ATP-binding protein [Paraburkholderia bonniea]
MKRAPFTCLGQALARHWHRLIDWLDPAVMMMVLGPLMIVLAWSITIGKIADERAQAIARAFATANGLARAFDEQSKRTIGSADQMLNLVRRRYLSAGQTIDIAQVLRDAAYLSPDYLRVRIGAADGQLIASSTPDGPRSMREREYFKVHLAHREDFLYISRPMRYELSEPWTIQLSRGIERRDGSFAGVVMASLEPSYFLQAFRDADFGEQDVAMLVGTDGIVRVRLRGNKIDFEHGESYLPLLDISRSRAGQAVHARSMIGGVERFWVSQQVGDYPLTVAVGLASERALHEFQRRRYVYLIGTSIFSVCVLVLTLLAGWLSARRRRILSQLAATERQANELKSSFIANISHDLRTPLNGIIGFADVLRESAPDAERRQYAQYILDSGNHLLALVNMILDLTKMRASKLQLHLEPTDLRALVTRVSNTHAMAARRKGLSYTLNIADEFPPSVMCDAIRITEVLDNLLHNAIKFTERGSVTLALLAAGDEVILRASDTGIGMSEEDQSHLFEMFAEGRDMAARANVGSGLGLAFSYELVKLHGGSVTVASKSGEGTVVTVRLPRGAIPASTLEDSQHDKASTGGGR